MVKLSALIITFNEQDNIEECIKSVLWADEIIVVDAFSSDKTTQICREYTDKIFQNKFVDFSAQKNFALSKAKNDWVLFVDADEKVSTFLKDEILKLPEDAYDAYNVPRKNIIFGKHLRYGGHQDDLQLRFFRRSRSHFENPIHESVIVDGKTGRLNNYLDHYSTRSLSEYAEKLNLYTDLEARLIKSQGGTIKKRNLIIKPVAQFIVRYLFKKGYKDGLEGFIFYSLSSFYTLVKYMKYWELQRKGTSS